MTNERRNKLLKVIANRQEGLGIVLENVVDPHNISAVMRTCDAVGIQDIYILNTRIPKHKKWGAKSSSSAAKWLTICQYDNTDECFAALRSKYDKILSTHLSKNAVSIYETSFTEKIAIVFGNEHSGVSDEVLQLSDGTIIIPQMGIIQSLNISVACAVTIYEAFRQRSLAGMYDGSLEGDYQNSLRKLWNVE